MDLTDITAPTLLIDEQRCRANLQVMLDRARRHGVRLAPHFKTHQSAEVGEWARDMGVEAITVTSLKMARYFADHDWTDITIAMPLNVRELPGLFELARRVRLTVFINSETTMRRVVAAMANTDIRLNFYIEIDAGYGRSGVRWDNRSDIDSILETGRHSGRRLPPPSGAGGPKPTEAEVSSNLHFMGFYTHSGNTYTAASVEDIQRIHANTLSRLGELRRAYISNYPSLQLSLGDTPACSVAEDFTGITTIRPGNFFYYDLTQVTLGVCTREQIAVCMACPVLEVHPGRGQAIIHGGWVQLGKDSLIDERGQPYYGEVVHLHAGGWTSMGARARVQSVSQEHGTVWLPGAVLSDVRVGGLVGVVPVHACGMVEGGVSREFGSSSVSRP